MSVTCTGCQGALRFTPIRWTGGIAFHSTKVELEKQQSAANLAGVLAKMGKRVFILDLGHVCTWSSYLLW